MSGMSATIIKVSIGLVATSITSEPSSVSVERKRDRDTDARDRLHERRIGREPRQHLARARDLEERRVHANDVGVHGVAHVGDDALAEPRDEIDTAAPRTRRTRRPRRETTRNTG